MTDFGGRMLSGDMGQVVTTEELRKIYIFGGQEHGTRLLERKEELERTVFLCYNLYVVYVYVSQYDLMKMEFNFYN